MKIAFLIPSLGAGGAERVMTHMANYWAQKNNSVIIFTLEPEASFYPLASGIQHIPLGERLPTNALQKGRYLLQQGQNLRRHLRQQQPQVLIAFLDIAIFMALVATRFLRVKVIVSERSNPYVRKTNPMLQSFNHLLYHRADRLVLQTQRIADTFPRLRRKITVIPNPLPPPHYQISDESYAASLERKTVVCIGRLTALKQYDKVLRAFHQFSQNKVGWKLILLGEGEERENLEQLRAQLHLDEAISLPGNTGNPQEVLKEASVFMLSSRFEGFPNALCEAMAVGLPSIATRCPYGPEEIIEHQHNGWLVPVDDPIAWAEALETVTSDISLYQKLGKEAKKVVSTYSIERIMQQWNQVIYDIKGISVK